MNTFHSERYQAFAVMKQVYAAEGARQNDPDPSTRASSQELREMSEIRCERCIEARGLESSVILACTLLYSPIDAQGLNA
jgi:hypothetical protein